MKRFIGIIVVAIIAFGIMGCSSDDGYGLTKTETHGNVSWNVNPSWDYKSDDEYEIYSSTDGTNGLSFTVSFSKSYANETPDEIIASMKKSMTESSFGKKFGEDWKQENLGEKSLDNATAYLYHYSFAFVDDPSSRSETYEAIVKSGSTTFTVSTATEDLLDAVLNTVKIN